MEGVGSKREVEKNMMASVMGKDKSTFSVTCSLLSQYLKEKKGGLGALGLEMAPPLPPEQHQARGVFRPPTTMNMLPGLDVSAEEADPAATEPCLPKSVDLFPQKAGMDPVIVPSKEENPKEGEKGKQLTIFYCGKVLIFDNFPSEKVKDLLQMANKDGAVDGASGNPVPPSLPGPAEDHVCDLPIARRNSLHRFLEKRKGRVIAKAPYQVNSSVAPSEEAMNDKCWLGLGQQIVKQEI